MPAQQCPSAELTLGEWAESMIFGVAPHQGALADNGAGNEFEGGRCAFEGGGPHPVVTHNTFRLEGVT
jgi:hypothetical protein